MRRLILLPSRRALLALAALSVLVVVLLLAGLPARYARWVTPGALGTLGAALLFAGADAWWSLRRWRAAPPRVERRLPGAFSLGVPTGVTLALVNDGPLDWQVDVFDEVAPWFSFEGLPQRVRLAAAARVTLRYTVTAQMRGVAEFGHTQLRWRTRAGCWEWRERVGEVQRLRVYPNFAALARYAWLSGDRRLEQIGIKTYQQRGRGTDFRQLADYRIGDSLRHIDWKATLRQQRPIVREFQDDRDQCVFFLLDCGRRMRADETDAEAEAVTAALTAPTGSAPGTPGGQAMPGGSHFDEALNALMLLSYVALKEGDEVGALTFGVAPGEARDFAPRKGLATLNALMNRLHDIQPGMVHSDYLLAARQLLRVQRRRALVIVLTNFRDEDAPELRPAVQLLRSRHLVMVASLRERVLGRIAAGPLHNERDAVDIAAAHLFEQARRDAFAHVVGKDPLSIDVEPARLAVALVNRYHAVKRAGLL